MSLFNFEITHNFRPRNKNKLPQHRLKRSSEVPIIRLATHTVPSELRPQKKHVTCAHHTTFQWHCDPQHLIQNFSHQTNQQSLLESNASCMLTTVQKWKRRQQRTTKICRKIKIRWRNINFIGCLRRQLWKSRTIRDLTTKKKIRSTSPTHHNSYVHHHSSNLKIWTPHQSANKISPPTLHILITGTLHHVCAKRTPRSTRDRTTIPNDFCNNSTTKQQITSHTGNRKHEWRATHHVPITLWSENMCCMISITNQINLQISIESLTAASCTLTRVYITECTKNNTQQKSPTHSILQQLTTMICTRSLCSIFRSLTIRDVTTTMPDVSIIQFPTHPIREQTHSQNNESPQTLDIVITRSVHHVCARRTQRGLVANNNANDNCSQKWYHALQLSTRKQRKENAATQHHHNTASVLRCVHHPCSGTQNSWSNSCAKQHAASDTEHRHHWNCPLRIHPKCDSWLNNSSQDCYYFT